MEANTDNNLNLVQKVGNELNWEKLLLQLDLQPDYLSGTKQC